MRYLLQGALSPLPFASLAGLPAANLTCFTTGLAQATDNYEVWCQCVLCSPLLTTFWHMVLRPAQAVQAGQSAALVQPAALQSKFCMPLSEAHQMWTAASARAPC